MAILVRTLRAAGLSAEQIVRVLETAENEKVLTRKSQNRINKKNQRLRQQMCADVDDSADRADTPTSPSPSSPITPSSPPLPSPMPADAAFPGFGPSQAELERELFRRGKQVCGKDAGGLIRNLLKAKESDVALARAVVETAATKHDPRQYVAACVKGGNGANAPKKSPII